MRFFRTFVSVFAVAALAACGGGSGGTVPQAGSDPGTRAPSGSTVAFQSVSLWVSYDPPQVNAFSTNGSGPVTPAKTLPSFPWSNSPGAPVPGIVDIAIAPDGTQYLLENRSATGGGPGWRLFAVAPGDNQPENTYGDDVDFPFAVGLGGDGIQVGYSDTNGVTTIATFAYAASNSPPIRTLQTTGTVLGFAEATDGYLYVLRTNHVDVYDQYSNGCCPVAEHQSASPRRTRDDKLEAVRGRAEQQHLRRRPARQQRDVRERVSAGVGQGVPAHRTAARGLRRVRLPGDHRRRAQPALRRDERAVLPVRARRAGRGRAAAPHDRFDASTPAVDGGRTEAVAVYTPVGTFRTLSFVPSYSARRCRR